MRVDMQKNYDIAEPIWKVPISYYPGNPEYVAQVATNMWLHTKGGKKLFVFACVNTTILKEDIKNNKIDQLEDIKKTKVKWAKIGLVNFIESYIGTRMGIKGYRGYFRIVDIEPYKSRTNA